MDPTAQQPGNDAPTIPGYDILNSLSGGPNAGVYLALQKNFDRHVAVKIARTAPDTDTDRRQGTPPIQRFLREARIAARLNHPHIIRVFDVGQYQGQAFLTMEFQEGGDLKRRLQQDITSGQVLGMTRQLASALDHAHGAGYVHGDIQPKNILLSKYDKAVLGNFGHAHATQVTRGAASPRTARAGAQRYLSPEQLRGLALDARSDFYSLGVVFYELLTGSPPFDHPDVTSLSMMILNDPTPQLRDELKALQPLLDGMLNRDIASRYASGRELINDIDRISSELPDQQLPRSRPLRATRADSVSNVSPLPQVPITDTEAEADLALNEARQDLKRHRHPLQRKAAIALGSTALAAVLVYLATGGPLQRWISADTTGGRGSAVAREQTQQLTKANADSLGGALGSYVAPGRSDSAVLAAGAAQALADLDPASASRGEPEARQDLQSIAASERKVEQPAQQSTTPPRTQTTASAQHTTGHNDRAQTLLSQFKITGLLKGANYDLSAGRYTSPPERNALEKYRQVLAVDPENREAKNGMARLESRIIRDLDAALAAGDDLQASQMRQQLELLKSQQ